MTTFEEYVNFMAHDVPICGNAFLEIQDTIISDKGLDYISNVLHKVIDQYVKEQDFSNFEQSYNKIYITMSRLEKMMVLYEHYRKNILAKTNYVSVREIFHYYISNILFTKHDGTTLMQRYLDSGVNNKDIARIEKLASICNFYKQNVELSGDNLAIINTINTIINDNIINNNYEVAKRYINISSYLDNTDLFDKLYINNLKTRIQSKDFSVEQENILKNYMLTRNKGSVNQIESLIKDYEDSIYVTKLHNNNIEVYNDDDFNKNRIPNNYTIIRDLNIKQSPITLPKNIITDNLVFKKLYEQCINNNFKELVYDYENSTASVTINSINIIANLYQVSVLYELTHFMNKKSILRQMTNIELPIFDRVIATLLKYNLIVLQDDIVSINNNYKGSMNIDITQKEVLDVNINTDSDSENSDEDFF